jgi:hypothetical protein
MIVCVRVLRVKTVKIVVYIAKKNRSCIQQACTRKECTRNIKKSHVQGPIYPRHPQAMLNQLEARGG